MNETVLFWYDENKRDLPWRATPERSVSTYETWLSEIMLQQTRVETVKSYFMAFTNTNANTHLAQDREKAN